MIIDWADDWEIPMRRKNIGYHVRKLYRSYSATLDPTIAPLPPRNDAEYELARLVRAIARRAMVAPKTTLRDRARNWELELTGAALDAARMIEKEPGMKGDNIARRIDCAPDYFRRVFGKQLRPLGFYHKAGYRPPPPR
jgi:hypothetical protein